MAVVVAEYIDRDKVYSLIKSTAQTATRDLFDREFVDGMECALNIVNEQPSADVEPVIHCSKCKYFIESSVESYGRCSYYHGLGTGLRGTDFCSFGVLKNENQ